MRLYRHRQRGTVIVVTMAIAAFAVVVAIESGRLPTPFSALVLVFFACLVLFGSLTVEVDHAGVSLRFGPGLIRRRFPLAGILAVRTVRNPWSYGWGIRLLSNGWLFNISGLDAVEIELTDGRTHRIGTDEPEALAAAIERARGVAS